VAACLSEVCGLSSTEARVLVPAMDEKKTGRAFKTHLEIHRTPVIVRCKQGGADALFAVIGVMRLECALWALRLELHIPLRDVAPYECRFLLENLLFTPQMNGVVPTGIRGVEWILFAKEAEGPVSVLYPAAPQVSGPPPS
jgi:hypothetical protein